MKFTYDTFTNFLKEIDLDKYRAKYSKTKIVEMDLPKNIQALQTIYEQYWQNKDNLKTPLSFEDYYKVYWQTHETDIKSFWQKSGFGLECDCFSRGLEARIYRTWASLITQIHGGYVAESVFGKDTIKMGTELDHRNVDILVTKLDGTEIKIQIKKVTHRPEFARRQENQHQESDVKDVFYIVPSPLDYELNFTYKVGVNKGKIKNSLKEFKKFNLNGTLDRLDNGFVVFTPEAFKELL
ncbi:TaqI family restriction endonuclease [Candidatus Avelusimicrobium caledoniensis]|uniref:TaqI family restriction endonuclease n=1 Tax=Candidatus Avelusimicrobium caledoniensis TaxID=3416220 RepID=UPI003D0ACE7F